MPIPQHSRKSHVRLLHNTSKHALAQLIISESKKALSENKSNDMHPIVFKLPIRPIHPSPSLHQPHRPTRFVRALMVFDAPRNVLVQEQIPAWETKHKFHSFRLVFTLLC